MLVAEDNPINQEVALAILHKLGCQTELAANGALAIRALQKRHFDLVLMDCEMPEMDGYQATERIRQGVDEVRDPGLPIIALTASAMPVDRDRCFRVGMNDYISKPVNPRQLAAVLARWLAPSASPAEALPAGAVEAAPAPSAAFNQQDLLDRLMGDHSLAGKLIASFLQDVPEKLSHLNWLIHDGDTAGIGKEAHALKGASANLSAPALRDLAVQMQQAAEAGDLASCSRLASQLDTEFQRFQAALAHSEGLQPVA